jgi:hypothetical protein
MAVFLLSFVVLMLIVVAMSVGVLVGRKPIKGSCGGMSALGMETACDVCGGDKKKCEKEQKKQDVSQDQADQLAYNAADTDGARKSDTNT